MVGSSIVVMTPSVAIIQLNFNSMVTSLLSYPIGFEIPATIIKFR